MDAARHERFRQPGRELECVFDIVARALARRLVASPAGGLQPDARLGAQRMGQGEFRIEVDRPIEQAHQGPQVAVGRQLVPQGQRTQVVLVGFRVGRRGGSDQALLGG